MMPEPPNPKFLLLAAAASLQAVAIGPVVVTSDAAVLNLAPPKAWQRLPLYIAAKILGDSQNEPRGPPFKS